MEMSWVSSPRLLRKRIFRVNLELMKGRSSARNAFTYHVAWTTSRARRFFRSLRKNMRPSHSPSTFTPEDQVELSSVLLSLLQPPDFLSQLGLISLPLTAVSAPLILFSLLIFRKFSQNPLAWSPLPTSFCVLPLHSSFCTLLHHSMTRTIYKTPGKEDQ